MLTLPIAEGMPTAVGEAATAETIDTSGISTAVRTAAINSSTRDIWNIKERIL
jgi:hypothetical protein